LEAAYASVDTVWRANWQPPAANYPNIPQGGSYSDQLGTSGSAATGWAEHRIKIK
jgi:hypothetical protein